MFQRVVRGPARRRSYLVGSVGRGETEHIGIPYTVGGGTTPELSFQTACFFLRKESLRRYGLLRQGRRGRTSDVIPGAPAKNSLAEAASAHTTTDSHDTLTRALQVLQASYKQASVSLYVCVCASVSLVRACVSNVGRAGRGRRRDQSALRRSGISRHV